MIDRETIDRIRDQTSIVAVIGESVKLRKRGRNYIGLCPFHQEKTPSFNVDEERGFYHCFGCGASGDVFRFLEQHGGLSFAEAVRRLAERAGVPIQETTSEPERRREDEARRHRQALLDVAASASEFFARSLQADESAPSAHAQLARWGLVASHPPDPVASALARFRVGYAPRQGEALVHHLRQSGLTLRLAESLGLLVRDPGTGEHRDRFLHRLVLPVLDLHGRAVAFIARRLDSVDRSSSAVTQKSLVFEHQNGSAQHLGCPESAVYAPRACVFGLHQARQHLRSAGQCIVVPQAPDVLCMHAHGFENAVALLGPTITAEQVRLIRRFTERVTFLFLADQAGVRAIVEAGVTCRREGLLVSVAPLPNDRAPVEILAGSGAAALQGVLDAARGLPEYLIDRALGSEFLTDDVSTRAARLRSVARLLQNESDPLVRAMAEQYADRVVQRLGVKQVRTLRALDVLVQRELRAVRRSEDDAGAHEEERETDDDTSRQLTDRLGREVLGAVLDQPELLVDDAVVAVLPLAEGEAVAAIAAVRRAWDRETGLDTEGLLARVAPGLRDFARCRLAEPQHRTAQGAKAAVLKAARQLAQSANR